MCLENVEEPECRRSSFASQTVHASALHMKLAGGRHVSAIVKANYCFLAFHCVLWRLWRTRMIDASCCGTEETEIIPNGVQRTPIFQKLCNFHRESGAKAGV